MTTKAAQNLAQNLKSKVVEGLYNFTFNTYFSEIPLSEINAILAANNLVLIQEDGTKYSGMFCGREGRALIEIAHKETARQHNGFTIYTAIDNSALVLEWYKIVTKFEINMYLS